MRKTSDYEAALAAIRPYFDNEPAEGSEEADHFDLVAMVIGKYEADTVAAVQLVMDSNGYSRADLAEILGGQSRVSAFVNRRRDLSLGQIRRLHAEWRIPADALIGAEAAA